MEPIEPAMLTDHGYAFMRYVRQSCTEIYPGPKPTYTLHCSENVEPAVDSEVGKGAAPNRPR
jgi:hypothetical protein